MIRVVMMPGRRYERFSSADEFGKFAQMGLESLRLAEPVAARHGVRLAVENHKDQRIAERLEVFRRLSSEYVGACVDTGNSFTLMEDTIEVVEAYAPWALSVMDTGGTAIIPLPPRGSHEDNLLPANSMTFWAYTDMADPRWTWGEKYLLLRQDSAKPTQ